MNRPTAGPRSRARTAVGAARRIGKRTPSAAAAARTAAWPARTAATVSWGELISDAEARLEDAGTESPAVDARRIAEEVSGEAGPNLCGILREPASRLGVARFDSLLARRLAGEPLQYVLGGWGFRSLDLMVDDRVLIPRPETEMVAGLAVAEVDARAASGSLVTAADLGTGSGAIALSVAAECSGCRVLASDRSGEALAVARANLGGLGRAASRVSLCQGDWFEALPADARGGIDVVVSNPPYVAQSETLPQVVDDWEPQIALRAGPRGDEHLRTIIETASSWLAPSGALVLEMAPDQTEPMAALAQSLGYEPTVHDDLAGRPRALVAQRA